MTDECSVFENHNEVKSFVVFFFFFLLTFKSQGWQHTKKSHNLIKKHVMFYEDQG